MPHLEDMVTVVEDGQLRKEERFLDIRIEAMRIGDLLLKSELGEMVIGVATQGLRTVATLDRILVW